MRPQHLAAQSSDHMQIESFGSQVIHSPFQPYEMKAFSSILTPDRKPAVERARAQVVGQPARRLCVYTYRRLQCLKLSRASWRWAWSVSLPPVVSSNNRKSSSSWTRSRFPSSLRTRASTSSTRLDQRGRAFGPAPTQHREKYAAHRPTILTMTRPMRSITR